MVAILDNWLIGFNKPDIESSLQFQMWVFVQLFTMQVAESSKFVATWILSKEVSNTQICRNDVYTLRL